MGESVSDTLCRCGYDEIHAARSRVFPERMLSVCLLRSSRRTSRYVPDAEDLAEPRIRRGR